MKTHSFLLVFIFVTLMISCGGDSGGDTPPPQAETLQERLTKVWVAQTVKEDNITVYQKDGTNNIKGGYTAFRLDLKSTGAVSFTEIGGTVLNGNWALSADERRLILSNLTPVPSETNGTLEFTILNATDRAFNISALSPNYKTGGTQNTYELIPN